MRRLLFGLTFSSLFSLNAHAEISRDDFIDQLSPAACDLPPEQLYIDKTSNAFDPATALSLSWISLYALNEGFISEADLASRWGVSNLKIIENNDHDLVILIGDHEDTTFVTFRHTDSNKNWLYNADYGLWNFDDSFTLGEKTHHGFARMLSSEWDTLLEEVAQRSTHNDGLWVFGHSLGAALAQLSAAGFQAEGLDVDKVYLTGAPKVGSLEWADKAEALLSGKVYRLSYKDDLIANLPIHHEALDEFRTLFSIVPDFFANAIGGVRGNMKFEALGNRVDLNESAYTTWTASDNAALEEQYWLNFSDDLAEAKQSTWNPIEQMNRMIGVVSTKLENHLLRSEDGYFCALIETLKTN